MTFVNLTKFSFWHFSKLRNINTSWDRKQFETKKPREETKKCFRNFREKFLCNMAKNKDGDSTEEKWLNSLFSNKVQKNWKGFENWKKLSQNVLANTTIPSKKDESWRFTPLSELFEMDFFGMEAIKFPEIPNNFFISMSAVRAVYINGIFSKKSSYLENLPEKVFIGSIQDFGENRKQEVLELLSKGESGIDGGFFPLLNMSCLNDIIVLDIPKNLTVSEPINIVFAGFSEEKGVNFNPRLVILAGENSSSTIIEHHIGIENSKYFDNSATSILMQKESRVKFTFLNEIPESSSQISSIHVDCQKETFFDFKSISFGGFLSRISLGVDLNGINSSCKVRGLTVAKGVQVADFHSRISHNFPKCQSSQLQKNLITGKAHGIFAGKIQVQHGAFETKSDQLCKTLLLSSKAKIDALPILEINNEDVKCTHGSTVSDLDENQIFYFQSRGITQEKARYLLTIGFVEEMIQGLPENLIKRFSSFIDSFL